MTSGPQRGRHVASCHWHQKPKGAVPSGPRVACTLLENLAKTPDEPRLNTFRDASGQGNSPSRASAIPQRTWQSLSHGRVRPQPAPAALPAIVLRASASIRRRCHWRATLSGSGWKRRSRGGHFRRSALSGSIRGGREGDGMRTIVAAHRLAGGFRVLIALCARSQGEAGLEEGFRRWPKTTTSVQPSHRRNASWP